MNPNIVIGKRAAIMREAVFQGSGGKVGIVYIITRRIVFFGSGSTQPGLGVGAEIGNTEVCVEVGHCGWNDTGRKCRGDTNIVSLYIYVSPTTTWHLTRGNSNSIMYASSSRHHGTGTGTASCSCLPVVRDISHWHGTVRPWLITKDA